MDRIYLYVPPEDYAEAKAAGARWDDPSKRWYTVGRPVAPALARWLDEAGAEPVYVVRSDEAYVASTGMFCVNCRDHIEVICLYCESGTDLEMNEPVSQVTLSNVWAMDDALAAQLGRWPEFKLTGGEAEAGYVANHCPHCGAVQEDYLLHSEPGEVFFCIPRAEPGSVTLTRLAGTIRVSGDIGFGV
jgi:Domain of unknown function (DUF5710)